MARSQRYARNTAWLKLACVLLLELIGLLMESARTIDIAESLISRGGCFQGSVFNFRRRVFECEYSLVIVDRSCKVAELIFRQAELQITPLIFRRKLIGPTEMRHRRCEVTLFP